MADSRVTVVQYGAGAIGSAIARLVLTRPDLRLVGVIDNDVSKLGVDAGKVLGLDRPLGFKVSSERALQTLHPDVVLHSTSSSLEAVLPQLSAAVRAGANVISTCEELSYPYVDHAEAAAQLSSESIASNVSVLGTGVNPGFVMDTLPALVSAVCEDITSITVTRVVDTALRRTQLQRKTGLGLGTDDFALKAGAGSVRHVGLLESAYLLAAALGWIPDRVEDRIEPVVATADLQTNDGIVPRGAVRGVHQVVSFELAGTTRLTLDLWMAYNIDDPRDEIQIEGSPAVRLIIKDGIFGDSATAGMVVNAIHAIRRAPSGLVTMLDMPLVSARLGQPAA